MTDGTAGGWSGNVGSLDDLIQKVVQGRQIIEGNY
jgi:hypothetical protein